MKRLFVLSLSIVMFSMIFVVSASAQTTVVVSGNTSTGENAPGWFFNRDPDNNTPYVFTNAQSSIGNGSLLGGPIDNIAAHKFIAEHFINVPISTVNSISADFMIGGNGDANDANQFYMNVYMNFGTSTPLNFYHCRYDVIATNGSTSGFTTITFNPALTYPVVTRGTPPYPCPSSPAQMEILSPGSNIRAYSLTTGDTSSSDVGLAGYWDNVVNDLDTGVTIFDFERAPAQCKNGGWALPGLVGSDGNPYINQGACVSDTVRDRGN
jgi:hypothetical protein